MKNQDSYTFSSYCNFNSITNYEYAFENVTSHADYYPGGMLLPGRHGSSDSYRYGFQSQEVDPEIKGEGNSINYKYRMYDPRIVRFFATDPLEYKFPYYSPYQFSSNSPIMAVELEGLESSVRINHNEGSINITRDANNRLTVTKSQLGPIFGHAYHSSGSTTNDLSPGGQYEVWCSDCAVSGTGGAWTTITIPKLQVVQYVDIQREVTETIPGDPGTDAKYKRENKTAYRLIHFTNSSTDPTNPSHIADNTNTAKSFVQGRVDKINDIGKGDPLVSAKVTSIDMVVQSASDFDAAIVDGLENEFGVKVNISYDASLASNWKYDVNYQVKTQTSAGTPATADQTVTKTITETVPVTVDPVIVTP